VAKNIRRAAGDRLCAECSRRGPIPHFTASASSRTVFDFLKNKISSESGFATNQETLILPIVFHIPGALREYTGGQSKVSIDSTPNTLQEALAALWRVYSGLKDRVVTEQGQLREHINIFIGDEEIRYTGGLMSPVPPGAEISIVPAISGGV